MQDIRIASCSITNCKKQIWQATIISWEEDWLLLSRKKNARTSRTARTRRTIFQKKKCHYPPQPPCRMIFWKSQLKKLQIIPAYHKTSPKFSLMPSSWLFSWLKVFLMQPATSPASPAMPNPQVKISFSLLENFLAVFLQNFWYSCKLYFRFPFFII